MEWDERGSPFDEVGVSLTLIYILLRVWSLTCLIYKTDSTGVLLWP